MIHIVLSALVAQAPAAPARPPDGTYAYSINQGTGPTILTSTVVVKSNGATFDVGEAVKLPNGDTATTTVTWDAATLLPVHYTLEQKGTTRTVDLAGPVTPTSVNLTGAAKLSYVPIAGTKYMLVSEGLNGIRMMLPFVVSAHPGQAFTIAAVNGNTTVKGQPGTSPAPNGPAGDTAVSYTIDGEQITAWYNPKTNVVDRELESPNNNVTLVKYTP